MPALPVVTAPAAPAPAVSAPRFVVGQDGRGCWVAVETGGLGGGLFRSRAAALHYALERTVGRPEAITLTTERVEMWP